MKPSPRNTEAIATNSPLEKTKADRHRTKQRIRSGLQSEVAKPDGDNLTPLFVWGIHYTGQCTKHTTVSRRRNELLELKLCHMCMRKHQTEEWNSATMLRIRNPSLGTRNVAELNELYFVVLFGEMVL
jgi:hypothetical protein